MAMGLASMNPMPSAAGGLFIRQKPDKDLENDPWSQYGVARDFDSNQRITMNNGKVVIKDNKDLRECMVYKINSPFVDKVFYELVQEANDENKEVHQDIGYLYECFTNHILLTDDQIDYDPLLERVYLDKLSKQLNAGSVALDMEAAGREKKESKTFETKRIGDEDEANTFFPMLAAYMIKDEDLSKLNEYFDNFITGEGEEIVEDL